jgi:hypothetical protein
MDSAGNLYINDFGNHAVRKVATTGVINTVFTASYLAMRTSVDGAGAIYFGDSGYCSVYKLVGSTRTRVLGRNRVRRRAAASTPAPPTSHARRHRNRFVAGNVLVVDADYARVRKLPAASTRSWAAWRRDRQRHACHQCPAREHRRLAWRQWRRGAQRRRPSPACARSRAGQGVHHRGHGSGWTRALHPRRLPCPATNLYLSAPAGVAYGTGGAGLVADHGREVVLSSPRTATSPFCRRQPRGRHRQRRRWSGQPGLHRSRMASRAIRWQTLRRGLALQPHPQSRQPRHHHTFAGTRHGRVTAATTARDECVDLQTKAVAVDAPTNVYFSDNLRVRKVTPAGLITTSPATALMA